MLSLPKESAALTQSVLCVKLQEQMLKKLQELLEQTKELEINFLKPVLVNEKFLLSFFPTELLFISAIVVF